MSINYWLAITAWIALLTWAFYMTVEPIARRIYPQSLISWTRLLHGHFRDPIIGRDLLAGMTSGAGLILVNGAWRWWTGSTDGPLVNAANYPIGNRAVAGTVAVTFYSTSFLSLALVAVLMLTWALARKRWIAWLVAFTIAQLLFQGIPRWPDVLFFGGALAIVYFTNTYAGILAFFCAIVTYPWLAWLPAILTQPTWYLALGVAGIVLWLATAAWALHASLDGRRLLQRDLFGE